MIIRDSYQAPLTWLLSDIFEEVEIIDLRNLNENIYDLMKDSDCEVVMFMFNNGLNVEEMLKNIKGD